MAKDSYWFRHDSTSGRGMRIRRIQHLYGHEGKGIYWDVIEVLREQENYCHPSDDSSLQMLADLIGYKDPVRFQNWFKDCIKVGLLKLTENGFISEVLSQNMVKWEAAKHAGIQSGISRNERKSNGIPTKPEPKTNETSTKLEHKRRVEEIREDNIIFKEKKNEVILKNEKPEIGQVRTFFYENGHETDFGEWADGFMELNEKKYGWLGLSKQTWQEMASNFKLVETSKSEEESLNTIRKYTGQDE